MCLCWFWGFRLRVNGDMLRPMLVFDIYRLEEHSNDHGSAKVRVYIFWLLQRARLVPHLTTPLPRGGLGRLGVTQDGVANRQSPVEVRPSWMARFSEGRLLAKYHVIVREARISVPPSAVALCQAGQGGDGVEKRRGKGAIGGTAVASRLGFRQSAVKQADVVLRRSNCALTSPTGRRGQFKGTMARG